MTRGIIMKRPKFLGLILFFTLLAFGFSVAKAQNMRLKTWKITVSQSGGFAGIMKSYTLDNEGNLKRVNKNQQNSEKIEDVKIQEIGKLVKELKLPGTKLKKVGGDRVYDGIYSSLVINLDGTDYNVEGNSFNDAKFLALNEKQKATLEKLKTKLNELNGFLLDSTTNINN